MKQKEKQSDVIGVIVQYKEIEKSHFLFISSIQYILDDSSLVSCITVISSMHKIQCLTRCWMFPMDLLCSL